MGGYLISFVGGWYNGRKDWESDWLKGTRRGVLRARTLYGVTGGFL